MFNNGEHKKAYLSLCPGELAKDPEWSSTIFMLTSVGELRRKTNQFISPKYHEIDWKGIMQNDFASGHYAAVLWAYSLWAGRSWSWNGDGQPIPSVDTMDKSYYMDGDLRRIALIALGLRWDLMHINP